MGAFSSPLVAEYCAGHALKVDARNPGPEGYILRTGSEIVVVAGSDDRGAFYGLQSLRQLAVELSGALRFAGYEIRDWPTKPFRGFKLYLPGRNNIPFFKRFVRDSLALYKYNTLIVEMNASMRFERHPELNSAWVRFSPARPTTGAAIIRPARPTTSKSIPRTRTLPMGAFLRKMRSPILPAMSGSSISSSFRNCRPSRIATTSCRRTPNCQRCRAKSGPTLTAPRIPRATSCCSMFTTSTSTC